MTAKKPKRKSAIEARRRSGSTSHSISRIQLSLLNSGLLPMNEDEKLMSLIPKNPIELSAYSKHVNLLRKYEVLAKIEYQIATKGESHSTRHATKEANELKNSYKKMIPYDYNRVVLEALPGIPDSDYINASFIDGILKPNAYIATQGPNEHTISDFWRAVWEQNSHVIVMLTKVFDFIRVMCDRYWPIELDHPEKYGDIEVTLLSETDLANYNIRSMQIKKGDEVRELSHLHYVAWPTHTNPFPCSLLDFRRRVKMYLSRYTENGPLIVHCSDGCGRTGAYICIDSNLDLADEDSVYDVYGYVKSLRNARRGMIEDVGQYKFIYEALEEGLISGQTWFPVSEISLRLKQKSVKSQITRQNEYQREYTKICNTSAKFTIGDRAGGHRLENRHKNRTISTVPPDNFRPYLSSFQSNDSTDYINAVFVDGYLRSKEFIVTEWPMQHTVPDFWSLVYDHDCNSVVVLCDHPPSSSYPQFYPTEKEKVKKFGPVFTIETVSFSTLPNIKAWIFKILKKVVSLTELMSGVKAEPKTTQLFFITCWPLGHKVPTSTNSLVELMNMVERWRQRTSYGPVLLVSSNGRSRVGVYCAASIAIEQAIEHEEVDVFTAVKVVRRHRPQLIENITEYKYCYDLLLNYIMNFHHKD
ncbi:receptor-type tyrosine-protein phosphatase kappa isoform X2 [Parasteatoda tepidariorum]|uniref:receptor-type tyrosine-protein phosphatase kappa isoform X2 n=2 Tax=Parasteatoda tepidariorum TaxID=114398 RepID=UPI001C718A9C|nr:receptor-type tyrosine-protein phosphatase kappa isoform X2 [Parasteatoda tepidariorum]